MTAPVACAKCGKALTTSRRLKSFCSYACRGQYKAQEATGYRSGLVRSKNTKQNRTLRSLKKAGRRCCHLCQNQLTNHKS
jgi:hypothetical protein